MQNVSLETSIVLRVKEFQKCYFGASEKRIFFSFFNILIETILSTTPLAFYLKKHPNFSVSFSKNSFDFYVISVVTSQKNIVWKILEMTSNQKEHLLLHITVNENTQLPVNNKYNTVLLRKHLEKYIRKLSCIAGLTYFFFFPKK